MNTIKHFVGPWLATVQIHAVKLGCALCAGIWLFILWLMLEGWGR